MKAIEDEIARVITERDALNNKLEGLRRALVLVGGPVATADPLISEQRTRQRRGNVKNSVLDIVTQQGEKGVTVVECVNIAATKGMSLDRGSVSSLLSRLKKDDVLFYDGERYRLRQYAGPRHAA